MQVCKPTSLQSEKLSHFALVRMYKHRDLFLDIQNARLEATESFKCLQLDTFAT